MSATNDPPAVGLISSSSDQKIVSDVRRPSLLRQRHDTYVRTRQVELPRNVADTCLRVWSLKTLHTKPSNKVGTPAEGSDRGERTVEGGA